MIQSFMLFGIYIDKFRFYLGIHDFLTGIESHIAGERIGYTAGNGKVNQISRSEKFDT